MRRRDFQEKKTRSSILKKPEGEMIREEAQWPIIPRNIRKICNEAAGEEAEEEEILQGGFLHRARAEMPL